MSQPLSKIFSPISLGGVRIRNRIAMAPMLTNLGTPEGYPSDALIAYMLERARGGVGLILTESIYVNRVDARSSPNQLGLYSDELVPKFARLTEAVKALGVRIFAHLIHAGRKTRRSLIWGNTPIAPSPLPLLDDVREMGLEDIVRVKKEFAEAAKRAEKAGFEGLELHGAHGYLIAQFLSPATNKRRDRYSDGARFVVELIEEIRSASDLPVGIRLSSTEFDPEGLVPYMVAEIASRLEKEAGVDYVHISAGRDGPLGSAVPFYYKKPAFLEEASIIRRSVRVPLFLAGSIVSSEDASKIIHVADVIVLGRQLLADPHWPHKILRGLPIKPCVRCNQLCRSLSTGEVRCDVNPELGWELLPPPWPGEGEVVVVGGGVMGLEAARVLALRGYQVELYEKETRLGGQINMYRDPYKLAEFGRLIDYYERELKRLGVRIHLNTETRCGDGDACIYAVPEERPPEIPRISSSRILIDSNLYPYHDYAFELARNNEVYITRRSLAGLERSRAYLMEKMLSQLGVIFVEKPPEKSFDLELKGFAKEQPSIGSSIRRGYWIGRTYCGESGQACVPKSA